GAMEQFEARRFGLPFAHVEAAIFPEVASKARKAKGGTMEIARAEHLERWWQFWNVRQEMRAALDSLRRYVACSQVTKRPIFVFLSTEVRPDATLQVWAFDDDYSFALLSASAHWEWFQANCSKLEARLRYTRRSVWDTFPFPQAPTPAQVDAVADAGRAVRRVRDEYLPKMKGGL